MPLPAQGVPLVAQGVSLLAQPAAACRRRQDLSQSPDRPLAGACPEPDGMRVHVRQRPNSRTRPILLKNSPMSVSEKFSGGLRPSTDRRSSIPGRSERSSFQYDAMLERRIEFFNRIDLLRLLGLSQENVL